MLQMMRPVLTWRTCVIMTISALSVLSIFLFSFESTWLATQVSTRSTRASFKAIRQPGRCRGAQQSHKEIEPGSIFFIDSAADLTSYFTFDLAAACAVESTALHNPTIRIQFLVFGNRTIHPTDLLTKMVINLPTVDIMVVSLEDFTNGTPYQNSSVTKATSEYFLVESLPEEVKLKLRRYLGDALRLLLLWNYGGIYLDQDLITLKSLDGFKNAAGCRVLEEKGNTVLPLAVNCLRVNAGVMALDQGHELALGLVKIFGQKQVLMDGPPNGNTELNRLLYKICGRFQLFQALAPITENVKNLTSNQQQNVPFVEPHWSPHFVYSLRCLASQNFTILDTRVFYPLPPNEVGYLFDPRFKDEVLSWINSSRSYLVHYFQTQAYKYFDSKSTDVLQGSAFASLVEKNCPQTFDIVFPNMPGYRST